MVRQVLVLKPAGKVEDFQAGFDMLNRNLRLSLNRRIAVLKYQ